MDEREIDWRGGTYKDLLEMPVKVRQTFGFALGLAQNNLPSEDAKTLSGFKPALVEILEDDERHLPCSLYGALRGRRLRAALLQEEVDQRSLVAKPR